MTDQAELLARLDRLANSDAKWELVKFAAAAIRDLTAKLAAAEAWAEKWCGDLPDRAMYELAQIFNRTAAAQEAKRQSLGEDSPSEQPAPAAATDEQGRPLTYWGGLKGAAAAPDPALPGLGLAAKICRNIAYSERTGALKGAVSEYEAVILAEIARRKWATGR